MSKTKTPQPTCPECEKLSAVAEESNKIGNFLDWMISDTDYRVCEYFETDHNDGYYPTGHSDREKLLALYFEIDLDKVEKERTALLKWLQEQHND